MSPGNQEQGFKSWSHVCYSLCTWFTVPSIYRPTLAAWLMLLGCLTTSNLNYPWVYFIGLTPEKRLSSIFLSFSPHPSLSSKWQGKGWWLLETQPEVINLGKEQDLEYRSPWSILDQTPIPDATKRSGLFLQNHLTGLLLGKSWRRESNQNMWGSEKWEGNISTINMQGIHFYRNFKI